MITLTAIVAALAIGWAVRTVWLAFVRTTPRQVAAVPAERDRALTRG
jgi:hypothetical protein